MAAEVCGARSPATALEAYRSGFLAVPASEATPLADDEVYLHELDGFAVRLEDGTPVGLVTGHYEMPNGLIIEVQGPKREFLLPYRKEFVRQRGPGGAAAGDRAAGRIARWVNRCASTSSPCFPRCSAP